MEHHGIAAKLLATVPRETPCGTLCPGVLPCPCPCQVAYQQALIAREERVLEMTLVDRFTPDTEQLQVLESGSWMALMAKRPFSLSWRENGLCLGHDKRADHGKTPESGYSQSLLDRRCVWPNWLRCC
jgi:hypothetical protein